MDPVSLVLQALASGAAKGVSDSASDAVSAAYGRLKQLVVGRFAGNKSAEVVLSEHAADPETWRVPLAKALNTTGADADESVIAAARQLMMLLDEAGARVGKYDVDLRGAQGVQVGDGNKQFNVYNSVPEIVVASREPRIRPGQPGNEAAFRPVYEAAGGAGVLGDALGEVHEDGPGFVQYFSDGRDGGPAVICAVYGQVPVAVAQEMWNGLCAVGGGTRGGGTAGAGFPAAGQGPFISSDAESMGLGGGEWGPGQLIRTRDETWRWQPRVAFGSQAFRDQDTWSMRRGEMDLRLRLAARIPIAVQDLRITETGRSRMLAALPATGIADLIAGLSGRYQLEPPDLTWQETPEPVGYNDTLRAAYEMTIMGPGGRTALKGDLWFVLPHGHVGDIHPIVDLSIDFDAVSPGADAAKTPASVPSDLRVTVADLVRFFSCAWQAAMVLPLIATEDLQRLPPAGPPRLELHIQNRRPENSGGPRILRTLDVVDLSPFGPTRKAHLTDLAVGITAPLGLSARESEEIVRKAVIRMAEDYGFTAAETAKI